MCPIYPQCLYSIIVTQAKMAFWSARVSYQMGGEMAQRLAQMTEQGRGLGEDGPRFFAHKAQVHKMVHSAFEHYFKGLLWIDLVKNANIDPNKKMKKMKLGHSLAKAFRHLPSCIQKKFEDRWRPLQPVLYAEMASWFTFDREYTENRRTRQILAEYSRYSPFSFSGMLEYIDNMLKWTTDPYFWQKPLSDPKTWFLSPAPFFEMLKHVDRIVHEELERFMEDRRKIGQPITEPFIVISQREIPSNRDGHYEYEAETDTVGNTFVRRRGIPNDA